VPDQGEWGKPERPKRGIEGSALGYIARIS